MAASASLPPSLTEYSGGQLLGATITFVILDISFAVLRALSIYIKGRGFELHDLFSYIGLVFILGECALAFGRCARSSDTVMDMQGLCFEHPEPQCVLSKHITHFSQYSSIMRELDTTRSILRSWPPTTSSGLPRQVPGSGSLHICLHLPEALDPLPLQEDIYDQVLKNRHMGPHRGRRRDLDQRDAYRDLPVHACRRRLR